MGVTSIEWTDRTWNPTRGCSRVSQGCVNCYAERSALRQKHSGYKGLVTITNGHPAWTGVVRAMTSETLEAPLHWKKPYRIFVNSMSDLFHEALPDEAIDRVFAVMALCPQHTFQVLTKRPERMLRYCYAPWVRIVEQAYTIGAAIKLPSPMRYPLRNVWLGVSVEDQKTADERIPNLIRTPAAKRFVSYEPALGPVDFERAAAVKNVISEYGPLLGVDWIIVGGESGPGARPFDIQWARNTISQCKAAGVAVFVKQLGSEPGFKLDDEIARGNMMPSFHHGNGGLFIKKLSDSKGGDMAEWPEELRVREFPA